MPVVIPRAFDRGVASPEERAGLFASLAVVLAAMRAAGMLGPAVRLTDAPPEPFGVGAKGPLVAVWQKVIGADPDGDFGERETLPKTRAWAKKLGFGDAKVVTPAMWATAVGVTLLLDPEHVTQTDGSVLTMAEAERAARVLDPAPTAK